MPHQCVNNPDQFCYICGNVTFASKKRPINSLVKTAYHHYFGIKLGHQDKTWAPHICCNSCFANLHGWINNNGRSMPFGIPMIWREPTNHVDNCYFCMVPPIKKGISRKKKLSIKYPNILSAIRPVPHGDDLPVPNPPGDYSLESDEDEDSTKEISHLCLKASTSEDSDYAPDSLSEPHRLTQGDLSDLIRDLDLPKDKAELLGSRLKQWNLLEPNVNVSIYRKRQKDFLPYFKKDNNLIVCCDVNGLMTALNVVYKPQDWRLFIDASKLSLKAVLLHNGNFLHSIPVGHAIHMKETYANMKLLLEAIKYTDHQWQIC